MSSRLTLNVVLLRLLQATARPNFSFVDGASTPSAENVRSAFPIESIWNWHCSSGKFLAPAIRPALVRNYWSTSCRGNRHLRLSFGLAIAPTTRPVFRWILRPQCSHSTADRSLAHGLGSLGIRSPQRQEMDSITMQRSTKPRIRPSLRSKKRRHDRQ